MGLPSTATCSPPPTAFRPSAAAAHHGVVVALTASPASLKALVSCSRALTSAACGQGQSRGQCQCQRQCQGQGQASARVRARARARARVRVRAVARLQLLRPVKVADALLEVGDRARQLEAEHAEVDVEGGPGEGWG